MQCQILGVSRHARMGGLGQACLLSFSLLIPFPLKPLFLAAVADAMICQ